MPDPSQFNTDRTDPGRWTVTFSNPSINMFVSTTIVELGALMTEQGGESVRKGRSVPVRESPIFSSLSLSRTYPKAAERPEVCWAFGATLCCASRPRQS